MITFEIDLTPDLDTLKDTSLDDDELSFVLLALYCKSFKALVSVDLETSDVTVDMISNGLVIDNTTTSYVLESSEMRLTKL